jgi:hypothetical protein
MNYKNTLIILLFSLNLQVLSQANIDKNNITEDLNKAKLKSELRASRKIEKKIAENKILLNSFKEIQTKKNKLIVVSCLATGSIVYLLQSPEEINKFLQKIKFLLNNIGNVMDNKEIDNTNEKTS